MAEVFTFVASQKDQEETIEASFRISGFKAEFWDPSTGEISPASYVFDGERTNVTIPLDVLDLCLLYPRTNKS